MDKNQKTEFKKNVTTGASTAAGATAGVILGSVISPTEAQAQEVPTTEPAPAPIPESAPAPAPKPQSQPEPEPVQEPTQQQDSTPTEVEVVAYDRVINEDGSQMDVAVLSVDGTAVGVLDGDLDGEADVLIADLNQNEVIEEGEYEVVQGQGIAMQPMQEAAGFDPRFAQNDLPDYVNDADVDTYVG